MKDLSPLQLAGFAATGAALLLDWPRAFRERIADRLQNSPDEKSRRALLAAIRRLGSPKVREQQAKLVSDAVPEAFEHVIVALQAVVKPVVGAQYICRAASISSQELRMIRDAGHIEHRVLAVRRNTQVQYDKADADDLLRRHREFVFASRLETALGTTRYATEQLVCLGEIEREVHPGLALINRTLRLVEESMNEFIHDLESKGRAGKPSDLMPLGTAARMMGGRPKFWGAILAAMREGSLPFWLDGAGKFIRRAMVHREDIAPFAALRFDELSWPGFPFRQTYTQLDAAEVLNLDSLQITRVASSGALTFVPEGVAVITDREPVHALATTYIATAEIAHRTGLPFNMVPKFMLRYPEIARHAAGWVRADFDLLVGGR
ncbi:hypothetical protein [Sphingomonas sp. ID0503]|uniref:hypothetical protein n=1 Tax=Sphingomonas sp. ID0503 TaxID=3399691 RepID=UPI003AFAE37D